MGSIRNINISLPPPPLRAYPCAFDYFPCPESREFEALGLPGGGEFDLCLGRVENLNRKCHI